MDKKDISQRNFHSILLLVVFIMLMTTTLYLGYFSVNLALIVTIGAILAGRFRWPILTGMIAIFTVLQYSLGGHGSAYFTLMVLGAFIISLSFSIEKHAVLKKAIRNVTVAFGVGFLVFIMWQMYRYYGAVNFEVYKQIVSSTFEGLKSFITQNSSLLLTEGAVSKEYINETIALLGNVEPLISYLAVGLYCFVAMSVGIYGAFVTYKSAFGKQIKLLKEFTISKTGATIMVILMFAMVFMQSQTMLKLMNVYIAFLPAFMVRGVQAIINIAKNPMGQGMVLVMAVVFFVVTKNITLILTYLAAFDCIRPGGNKVEKL